MSDSTSSDCCATNTDIDSSLLSNVCQQLKERTENCVPADRLQMNVCKYKISENNDQRLQYVMLCTIPTQSNQPESETNESIDLWESKVHIKMPHSALNQVILVKHCDGKKTQDRLQKWEVISNHLAGELKTSDDLVTALKAYNPVMANDDFAALYCVIDECYDSSERKNFFDRVLPGMIHLALRLPQLVKQSIPILKQKENKILFLNQEQVACLLANAFLCTYPKRSLPQYKNLPEINFKSLFSLTTSSNGTEKTLILKIEKLKCILNYFRRVTEEMPKGVISFERRSLSIDQMPNWRNSTKRLCPLQVFSEGLIESEGKGMLQVDFANKMVGGGVLNAGCVQEEIRFVINPELIVSRLFTEKLMDNEVLIITGTEQFNRYTGYSETFRFKGDFVDKTEVDTMGRRSTQIVALDATYFSSNEKETQYQPEFVNRELNKAYTAFVNLDQSLSTPVATGNWGCGAFNGDPQFKAVLQLLAASESGREMFYFTFNNNELKTEFEYLYDMLQLNDYNVGTLYSKVCSFWLSRKKTTLKETFFHFLINAEQ